MNAVKLQQEIAGKEYFDLHYSNENQLATRRIPEGYMTGEEFWRLIREDIDKIFKEKKCGLL